MTGNAEDDLKALARLCRRVDQLQQHYFTLRKRNDPETGDAVAASKRAERELRAMVAAVLDFRTPDLFSGTEASEA